MVRLTLWALIESGRFDQEALDELVHEHFAGLAADKNNEGPIAQVSFLLKEAGMEPIFLAEAIEP